MSSSSRAELWSRVKPGKIMPKFIHKCTVHDCSYARIYTLCLCYFLGIRESNMFYRLMLNAYRCCLSPSFHGTHLSKKRACLR